MAVFSVAIRQRSVVSLHPLRSSMLLLVVMLLSIIAIASASVSAFDDTGDSSHRHHHYQNWTPVRVSYQDLVTEASASQSESESTTSIWESLKRTGMVSITDIPGLRKQDMFHDLEGCVNEAEAGVTTNKKKTHVFDDGTIRETIATKSIHQHPEQLFPLSTSSSETATTTATDTDAVDAPACNDFVETSSQFRTMVQLVTSHIATIIGHHSRNDDNDDGSSSFVLRHADGQTTYNVQQTIMEGEHLEHFHPYTYNSNSNNKDDNPAVEEEDEENEQNTIDWHTDQGIFIVFTPGQFVNDIDDSNNGASTTATATATDGLYVQLNDNQPPRHVQLDIQQDDLIVMLGDGVYPYINPSLNEKDQLTSVSHALKLRLRYEQQQQQDQRKRRVWYGRMVLPPPDAIHPGSPTGQTVGEIRNAMIRMDSDALLLGCSGTVESSSHTNGSGDTVPQVTMVARELTENTEVCEEGTSDYCWHRCMNHTDYDVSPTICEQRSLSLACVNGDGFLWTGKHDPEFGLGCVNLTTAENVTYPDTESPSESPTTPAPSGAFTTITHSMTMMMATTAISTVLIFVISSGAL